MSKAPGKDELRTALRRRGLSDAGGRRALRSRLLAAERERDDHTTEGEDVQDDDGSTGQASAGDGPDGASTDTATGAAEPARAGSPDRTQQSAGTGSSGSAPARASGTGGSSSAGGNRAQPADLARAAARQLAELSRHRVEGIAGLSRDEQGWRVEVEVLEVSRVPSSTDVLGTYAVWVDDDGGLLSYERVERFVRGQASGGEG